jgi:hypothetical protein
MCTLASVLDVPVTDPESVLTGSGIAARETIAIRVPRAARVRLRFIEMLLGNLKYYFFGSADTIIGVPNTGERASTWIRSWYVAVPSTCRETRIADIGLAPRSDVAVHRSRRSPAVNATVRSDRRVPEAEGLNRTK